MNEFLISLISLCSMTASGVSYYLRSLDRLTIGFFLISVYVAALLEPAKFVPAFTLLLIGNYVGLACHEFSHYFISRIWMDSSDLRVNLTNMSTEFDAPYDAPEWGIRIIAGIPYLLMMIGVSAHYVLIGFPDLTLSSLISFVSIGLVAFFMGLGAGVSPSDVLGMLYPAKFQEFAATHNKKDTESAFNILRQSIKTSLS